MAKEFRALVENLVSAHAFLVQPVVGAFVAALRNGPATLSIKYDRIHNVLSSVIRLIPTGLTFMTTILNEYFPHKTEDVADNVWYTKNLMRIVSYAPVLRNAVWAIVIDRMMQMDVEIQGALEKLDEEEYSTVLAHCFEIDSASVDPEMISFILDENNEEDDAESASDEEEVDDEDEDDDEDDDDEDAPVIVSDFRKMSGRLDSMLHYLMTQVTEVFNSSAAITNEESFEFFSVLLQIFERTVLPTHQCKYVQFLYFHATSLSQSCTEHFLVRLAQRTFDTGSPALLRVAASAYLSSFVARAKFVRPDNVMYCIKMLNSWALSYVEEYEPTLKVTSGGVVVMEGGGKMQHTVFYAVVQALLYVFCFRWREIVDSSVGVGSGGVPAEMNGFQRIVMSKFAPMSVCSRTVVAEFARITHKLDMMYVYAHMQGQQPMEVAAGEYLEAFFPFDPCHLLLSKRLIERHYNEWSEEEETAASSVPNGGAGGKGFDSDVDFISHSFENQMSLSAD
ncbi:RNA polymerase I-specific transcription initiation factor RRN3 [Chytriomyces sp. MP71]|nr:RNA polymerase I-specific transcription initiation factor RRN3 [Chytriomyces sp. MP71]